MKKTNDVGFEVFRHYQRMEYLIEIFIDTAEFSDDIPDRCLVAFQVIQEEIEKMGEDLEKLLLHCSQVDNDLGDLQMTEFEKELLGSETEEQSEDLKRAEFEEQFPSSHFYRRLKDYFQMLKDLERAETKGKFPSSHFYGHLKDCFLT